jgi:hypothetical protein
MIGGACVGLIARIPGASMVARSNLRAQNFTHDDFP